MNNLCMIPARGGSKRFPRKNLAKFRGRPLITYAVNTALESGLFAEVAVSTEDPEVRDTARAAGAVVPYARPAHLAADDVPVLPVAIDLLEHYAAAGLRFETVCILYATAPLTTVDDVRRAYRLFERSDAPVLHSVAEFEHSPHRAVSISDGLMTPMFGMDLMEKQTQELPTGYRITGAISIMSTDYVLKHRSYYSERMLAYSMSRDRSIDIDTPFDLRLLEFLADDPGQE